MRIPALVLAGAVVGQALIVSPARAQSAPAAAPVSTPEDRERSRRIEALQQEIAAVMLREGTPGAAVALVSSSGVLWMGGFGEADPARGRQATPSTPFAAAAISPIMVGLLAARYASLNTAPKKEGDRPRAPLDEPVEDAALNLQNPFAQSHALTLATLLEQTSGLEDLAPSELLPAKDPSLLLTEVLRQRPHPARWVPGSRFSPSRPGIVAAAAQLERFGKRPFFSVADAELFKPLALYETTFRPDASTLEAMAQGHQGRRAVPWTPKLAWPALGLVTSVEDLASLLRMILDRGFAQTGPAGGKAILSPPLLDRVARGTLPGAGELATPGLGTRVGFGDGHAQVGQEGVFEGGGSALVWFPAENVGYAVLLNSASVPALEEIQAIARRFLLRDAPRAPLAEGAASLGLVARASGVWRLASVRLEAMRLFEELFGFAVVHAQGGSIAFSPSLGAARTLVPAGDGLFRGPNDASPSVALIARPEGDELIAPEGTYVRASAFATYGRLAFTLAALLAMLSSLLFALVWLPRALFGRLKNSPDLRLRAAPALASLVFFELLFLLLFSNQPLGTVNLTSLLVCALTLVFPALSLAALLECLRGAREAGGFASARLVRAHAFACSLLASFLSLELALHGLAGLRTWML